MDAGTPSLQPTPSGSFLTLISIFSAGVSLAQVQAVITLVASVIAICSGIMAIRYYFYMTKKINS